MAYSSRKGLAPWRGQCHQPGVGVPPLRPACHTSWAAPPTKKITGCHSAYRPTFLLGIEVEHEQNSLDHTGPFTAGPSRNRTEGNHKNSILERPIASYRSASLAGSWKVLMQTLEILFLRGTLLHQPLNYLPNLGCHTLALQSMLRPHLKLPDRISFPTRIYYSQADLPLFCAKKFAS